MTSKPNKRKDILDVISAVNREQRRANGVNRANYTGLASADFGATSFSSSSSSGSTNNSSGSAGRLKTAGDAMIGPLAFHPVVVLIDGSDTLDISESTNTGYSSRVIVNGATSSNLNIISGAAHAGQIVFLQAVETTPITIKHAGVGGNIWIPTLTDYIITDKEIVVLQYDETNTVWSCVANFTDGSGGGGEVTDWTTAHRANGNSFFLDLDDDTLIEGNTDDENSFHIGGTPDMIKMTATQLISQLDIIPLNGTENLGASAGNGQFDNAFIDEIIFTNNKTFSASVASIGTESAGEIVINAPTSQSIHFRVAGSDRAEIDSTGLTMPSGNHGVKLIGGDIDVETGNITMGATGVGDLTVGDGRVYIYDKGTNDSKIFMKHGAGASTDQYLYSDGNGIELAAASGNTVKFRVAGTVIANVRDTGLYMNDATYIIPATSGDVMGIMPKNTGLTLTTGTKGSILIPTYESTTTTTDALLTTWFGNQAGAIGMQYDTSKATGSGRMMLYIRGGAASGTWRGVDFDVNPP